MLDFSTMLQLFLLAYDATINAFNGDFDKVISCRDLAVPLMDRIKLKGIEAQPQVTNFVSPSDIREFRAKGNPLTFPLA